MTGEGRWRVLIVVKHPLFRETVRYVLTTDPHFSVVAEVGSGEEAVAITRQIELDLALIEMRLPEMNGLATAAAIKANQPRIIILILSGEWSPAYERRARAIGVRARLAKQNFSLSELYRALG